MTRVSEESCIKELREVSKLLLPDRPCSSEVCADAADYLEALVDEVEAVRIYGDSLRAENKRLREAVSGMNPNNPFSVIEVQAMVEGE